MDSVVINGKNYFSEDHIKAKSAEITRDCVVMAVNSIETALKDLRQMMALPQVERQEVYLGEKQGLSPAASLQKESMSLEKVIAVAVSPNSMPPLEIINKVTAELRKDDVPTAALIQGCNVVTVCNRYGIVYLHVPFFMEPMFMRDTPQCEKRRKAVTKAVRAVLLDQALEVFFVTSNLKSFNGDSRKIADEINLVLSSQAETIWHMTPTQRTVYVGWRLIDAEVRSGARSSYTYADLRTACGMTHSTTYHAMRRLVENGYVNLNNLAGKGIKNNEA